MVDEAELNTYFHLHEMLMHSLWLRYSQTLQLHINTFSCPYSCQVGWNGVQRQLTSLFLEIWGWNHSTTLIPHYTGSLKKQLPGLQTNRCYSAPGATCSYHNKSHMMWPGGVSIWGQHHSHRAICSRGVFSTSLTDQPCHWSIAWDQISPCEWQEESPLSSRLWLM